MEIKIIEKRNVLRDEDGQKMRDKKWPSGANAYIYMGGSSTLRFKHATVVYENLRHLHTGWQAGRSNQQRRGWNFGCAELKDEENARLVFGHLIDKDECVIYFLHLTDIDPQIRTMLQLGMEIVRQLELQI